MNNRTKSLMLGLAFSLLVACGDDDPGVGRVSLYLAETRVDPASQVMKVMIEFSGVELHQDRATPQRFLFEHPQRINLLALPGGDSITLLDEAILTAGRYSQLRLLIKTGQEASAPTVELSDGSVHPLFIPSINQSGLNLNTSFTVPKDGYTSFAIDFDLRKSVTNPRGLESAYILRPTLRPLDKGVLKDS